MNGMSPHLGLHLYFAKARPPCFWSEGMDGQKHLAPRPDGILHLGARPSGLQGMVEEKPIPHTGFAQQERT